MKPSRLTHLFVLALTLGLASGAQRGGGPGQRGAPSGAARPEVRPPIGSGRPPSVPPPTERKSGVRPSRIPPAEVVERNPQLRERLLELLPPGSDPVAAAKDFPNLGEFISTAHVAHNLGLPFDQLKAEVLRQGSLGKALQLLRPDLPRQERERLVERARERAREFIRQHVGQPQ